MHECTTWETGESAKRSRKDRLLPPLVPPTCPYTHTPYFISVHPCPHTCVHGGQDALVVSKARVGPCVYAAPHKEKEVGPDLDR